MQNSLFNSFADYPLAFSEDGKGRGMIGKGMEKMESIQHSMLASVMDGLGGSWSALAERSGDSAFGRTEGSRVENNFSAGESGVELRLPPQSKTTWKN